MLGLRYRILELQKLHSDLCALVDEGLLMDERKGNPLSGFVCSKAEINCLLQSWRG